MSDAYRSIWDYLRNAYSHNAGLRLDHFLLKDLIADKFVTAEVDKHARGWEHSSNHASVWIELRD